MKKRKETPIDEVLRCACKHRITATEARDKFYLTPILTPQERLVKFIFHTREQRRTLNK